MSKLKMEYPSLDDIPTGYRELYEEQDGGVYRLSGVEGMDSELNRMKRSLESQRKKISDERGRFSEVLGKRSLEQVADLIKKAEEGEDKEPSLPKSSAIARERDMLRDKLAKQEEEIGNYRAKLRKHAIRDKVWEAASREKIVASAKDDVLLLAETVFDVGDDGAVFVKEGSNFHAGSDPSSWIGQMKKQRPHWWPASSGGSMSGSSSIDVRGMNNPWSKEHFNITEQMRIFRSDPELAKKLGESEPSVH